MLKCMLVSHQCAITFAFTARELDAAPFVNESLFKVHRYCWKYIREVGAGSEPSAKGMLLREVGSTQSH